MARCQSQLPGLLARSGEDMSCYFCRCCLCFSAACETRRACLAVKLQADSDVFAM